MSRYLALVPALNEAAAIGRTIAEINTAAPDYEVLVIDDGSTDGTADLAASAGAQVLRMPFNLGLGGAMQAGYLYARDHGTEIAVQIDGDGQHDPGYIPEMQRRLLQDPDLNMVRGSRFLEPGGGEFRSSAGRRAGITLFARLLSRISGQRVTDPTSGLRMTDRKGIELFARDYPHDYPEVEAILLMHAHRLRMCEVPVRMRPRTSGSSTITGAGSVYFMLKVLLAVFVGLFRARPVIEPGDEPLVASEPSL